MYIPEIGDIITLKKDWTFVVHDENRNKTLIKAMNIDFNFDVEIKGDGNVIDIPDNINQYIYQYYTNFLVEHIDKRYNLIGASTSLISAMTHENMNYTSSKYKHYDIKITNSKKGINKKASCFDSVSTIQNIDKPPAYTIKVDVDVNYQTCTLPKGTELKIDRIYIRKGNDEYSSITFYIEDCPDKTFRPKKKIRFWAKLSDVNTFMFE